MLNSFNMSLFSFEFHTSFCYLIFRILMAELNIWIFLYESCDMNFHENTFVNSLCCDTLHKRIAGKWLRGQI